MLRIQQVFKVRLVYKSGYAHDIELERFKIQTSGSGKTVNWNEIFVDQQIVQLGLDDLEAVFVVGFRKRLTFRKKLP